MTFPIRRSVLAAVLVIASACSSQPAPHPAPPPAAAPSIRPSSAFCGSTARVVRFSQVGIGLKEQPFEAAVTDRYVWVLVDPARLLRIPRDGEGFDVLDGAPGEVWTAMDADPRDGSIWIAARDFGFVHIAPDLQATRVRLQHAVEGESGFVRLLVGPDALYVQPFCSDRGVWRIGWDGKPLGTAFPEPQKPGDGTPNPERIDCSPVRLERRGDGRLLARDPERHVVYALGEGGAWRREPGDLFAGVPRQAQYAYQFNTVAGDAYRFAPFAERLLDWKGRPILLGHPGGSPPDPRSTVFYALGDEGGAARPAACSGRAVRNLVTGAGGYAAVLPDFVIFGDLAAAPDLP
jgi:hypothetical protein